MNITFKQGIIKYPTTGILQSFLQRNGDNVNLLADNGSTLVTFTHGSSNYIYEELLTVTDAWIGAFASGGSYWLYWDVNTLTGVRTFGHTILQPATSVAKPSSPTEGQHWFDLANNKMFVYESGIWRNVIRVFAAFYDGINFSSMSSGILNFPFAGSQTGATNVNEVAGKILFNDLDKPILRTNRELYHTESIFNVNGSNIDTLRLESSYEIVAANETLPSYHVVNYVAEGKVELAGYNDVDSILAMVTEDATLGSLANVILSGIVSNPSWNYTDDVGTPLWVLENGELVDTDPHFTNIISYPRQNPAIAKVVSSTSLLFQPTYQGDITVENSNPVATVLEAGIVKISTNPVSSISPIAVSDTDPRLIDDRTPLPHTHDAIDTPFASGSGLASIDVRNALDELNDSKADIAGTTFTGTVLLHSDPFTNLQAATKKYVDDLVSGLLWIEPIQFVNVIGNTLGVPPVSPEFSDTYIIPTVGVPTGVWSAMANDDIVQWDGVQWNVLDNLSNLTVPTRFGVAFTTTTTPFGVFIGQAENIGTLDSGIWTFETPAYNNATLINSVDDVHAYHQYAFNTQWVEYAGPHTVLPGINIEQIDNTFNVVDASNGGTVDAKTLNGLSDTALVKIDGTNAMTAELELSGNPTALLSAAPKQYVDTEISNKTSTLPELTDVDATLTPADEDVLYYDGTANLWKSKQVSVSSGTPYEFTTLSPVFPAPTPGRDTIDVDGAGEYYSHSLLNELDVNVVAPNAVAGQRDRIILMLEQDDTVILPTNWTSNNILWADSDSPDTIGNTDSAREILEVELWEDKLSAGFWLGSYKRYRQVMAAILIPSPLWVLDNPNYAEVSTNDKFGWGNVAVNSTRIAVAASNEEANNNNTVGVVYLFDLATGLLVTTIENPVVGPGEAYDDYGTDLDMDDTHLIVGSRGSSLGNSGIVFVHDATTGAFIRRIENPNVRDSYGEDDDFANALALSGTTAIVGSFREEDASGYAYLHGLAYLIDISNGNTLHVLVNPNEQIGEYDYFGYKVSISPTYSAVGSEYDNSDDGTAFVFTNSTGALLHTIVSPEGQSNEEFGTSVSNSDVYLAVGSGYSGVDQNTGRVYIFDIVTGNYLHTIENPNAFGTGENDFFGGDTRISGTTLVVAAPSEDDAGGSGSGKVYGFDITNGDLLWTLDNPNAGGVSSAGDAFGGSIGVTATHLVVAAPVEDDTNLSSGKAYVYEFV